MDWTMEQYDFLIVGGGVVGLATAMELTHRFPGKKTVVVEKERSLASHQSTHNSGVIHSGIYYRPGSLKAKTCVEGAREMKAFCKEHHISMEETGKLILATDESELPRLEELYRRGIENGVCGVSILDEQGIQQKEPYAKGIRALWVPGTSIVSYRQVCDKFAEMICGRNGKIRLGEKVYGITVKEDNILVSTTKETIATSYLINCAGLHSDQVASMAGVDPGVLIVPFRGEYYRFKEGKEYYVKGLIYPVPNPALPFLGVHFTKMIDGGVELGPNAVLALKREGYSKISFSLANILETLTYMGFWKMALRYWKTGIGEMVRSFCKSAFLHDARRMIPDIKSEDIEPYKAGVRAQALDSSGNLVDDFWVKESHRMVHVLNAPSPAATASICIGRQIVDMCKDKFSL
jgi:L-2-hydroxyglutarate oxidase LhgO